MPLRFMFHKRLLLLLGPLIAWICSSFCSLAFQAVDPLLDHDEIYWIGSSYYYDLAFVQREWSHPAWKLLPARENPPVAKYLIGFGLATAGHHITTIDNLSYFYLGWLGWENNPTANDMGADAQKRVRVLEAATPGFRQRVLENRRAPLTRPVVQVARNTIMLCTVAASLLLFLLGIKGGDWLGGLLASQLLLLHPAVVSACNHAMADAVALMFSNAAALAAFCWFSRFSRSSQLGFKAGLPYSFTTGLLLALACGSKMNSLVMVILTGVLVAIVAVEKWFNRARTEAIKAAVHGVIILLVAITVFVAINPAIIQDLPGGLAATVLEHRRTSSIQMDLNDTRLFDLPAKVAAVISLSFYNWIGLGVIIAIVGWNAACRWYENSVRFAVCWLLVAFICVTLWIPFTWPRYIIPLLPPTVWLAGCFLATVIRQLAKNLGNRIGRGKKRGAPALESSQ
jgi:Dolichyl-phosphate-mannose-protein mannosyltransferase